MKWPIRRPLEPSRSRALRIHAKATNPFACNSTLAPYDQTFLLRGSLLVLSNLPRLRRRAFSGGFMRSAYRNTGAASPGVRMLRTALSCAIAGRREDAAIVEVTLNPDGRFRIESSAGDRRGAPPEAPDLQFVTSAE
jgi:hypothetical protein